MQSPHIFAEWCVYLDMLREGEHDQEVLRALQTGTLDGDDSVKRRFACELQEIMLARVDKVFNWFSLAAQSRRNEADYFKMMKLLREEFVFLNQLASLSVLDNLSREELQSSIRECAENTQQNLENNVKNDRTGKYLRLVMQYRVDDF